MRVYELAYRADGDGSRVVNRPVSGIALRTHTRTHMRTTSDPVKSHTHVDVRRRSPGQLKRVPEIAQIPRVV